ncbi:hypothetical protein SAMN05421643_101219 [Acinetobacter kyonggiensis]|uniref:Uncharacterized protein n=1 Tax=Acinetobacter kyonggiensis TaxID=595670 RepID=A0A1H3FPC2_9GAMM|nr:hypothetical protein SAMN05421643_101219 [Acinetobacter kyonggiensis]
MKHDFIPTVLLAILALLLPSYAFAQIPDSSYIIMGSGLLLVFALAMYVFSQIRKSIQVHMNKPTK